MTWAGVLALGEKDTKDGKDQGLETRDRLKKAAGRGETAGPSQKWRWDEGG
jgi:hypothetical protein